MPPECLFPFLLQQTYALKIVTLIFLNLCVILEWLRREAPASYLPAQRTQKKFRFWSTFIEIIQNLCIILPQSKELGTFDQLTYFFHFYILIFLMSTENMNGEINPKIKKKYNYLSFFFFFWNTINWGRYLLAPFRIYASVLVFPNKFCGHKEMFCISKKLRVNVNPDPAQVLCGLYFLWVTFLSDLTNSGMPGTSGGWNEKKTQLWSSVYKDR